MILTFQTSYEGNKKNSVRPYAPSQTLTKHIKQQYPLTESRLFMAPFISFQIQISYYYENTIHLKFICCSLDVLAATKFSFLLTSPDVNTNRILSLRYNFVAPRRRCSFSRASSTNPEFLPTVKMSKT